MAEIIQLHDEEADVDVLPITHKDAIFDDDGNKVIEQLETKLETLNTNLNGDGENSLYKMVEEIHNKLMPLDQSDNIVYKPFNIIRSSTVTAESLGVSKILGIASASPLYSYNKSNGCNYTWHSIKIDESHESITFVIGNEDGYGVQTTVICACLL